MRFDARDVVGDRFEGLVATDEVLATALAEVLVVDRLLVGRIVGPKSVELLVDLLGQASPHVLAQGGRPGWRGVLEKVLTLFEFFGQVPIWSVEAALSFHETAYSNT